MKKILLYISFIIVSIGIVFAFVTSKTYVQLGFAVILYPLFIIFAYKIFIKDAPSNAMSAGPAIPQNPVMNNALPQVQTANAINNTNTNNTKHTTSDEDVEKVEVVADINKRAFLKLVGAVGTSYFIFSLLGQRVESLFFNKALNQGGGLFGTGSNQTSGNVGSIAEGYRISEVDDTNYMTYYGFVNKEGAWFIMKEDINENTFRYSRGSSNFSENWNNRESLKYDYYYNLF